MKTGFFLVAVFCFAGFSLGMQSLSAQSLQTETNVVLEWSYTSTMSYQNPFREVDLIAEIEMPDGSTFQLPASWAGESTWKFRFSAPVAGSYSLWRSYHINGLEAGKAYDVTWFNPITGATSEDSFTANGEGKIDVNRVPIMQDWLLLINL